MIRLLSYIYPITKKTNSDYNGVLEIIWYRGKKMLDSKNANFLYGSLEKILKIEFQNMNITSCKNILLLGLGGGNVIKNLQQYFNYLHNIAVIEIDLVIITIVKDKFFNANFWKNLTSAKQILFNAASHVDNSTRLNNIKAILKKHHFTITQLDNVNKTNTLLIAKKTIL